MRAAARRGPFVTDVDGLVWIDMFLLQQFVTILGQTGPLGAPSVIARVPVRGPALTGTNLRLAAGSVWLAARVQAVEADEADLRELE